MEIAYFTNIKNVKNLFLTNRSTEQTIFKNTAWLAGATFVNKILRFILFVYIARIMGAADYGKFTFAMAFAGLFIMFSDFGLAQIVTRDFSQDKKREEDFPAVLSLKIFLTAGALFLTFLGSLFITPDPAIRVLIVILAISLLGDNFTGLINSFFRGRQKMEYQAIVSVTETVITFGIGMLVLFFLPSVENLSYSYLLASLIAFFSAILILNFKFQKFSFRLNAAIWKKFMLVSWPLALIGILTSVYNQTDSVMLGYFNQITQNGWYNAAYRIIAVTLIPTGLISVSVFPALSKAFKESKEKMQKIWDRYLDIMIFLAIPVVAGGVILASRIINVVYGASYAPAILALQILLFTSGLMFLYIPFQQALIIFNRQKKIFLVTFSAAIFNVVFNAILIPRFSLYGAAAATVGTNLLLGGLFLKLMLNSHFISPFDKKTALGFGIAVFSVIIMYFVLSIKNIAYEFNIILVLTLAAFVYSAAYLILKRMVKIFVVL